MYDFLIRELFPNTTSFYTPADTPYKTPFSFSDITVLIQSQFQRDIPLPLNCLSGEYKISDSLSHFAESYFPSSIARRSFLYIQLLCSITFDREHYTQRRDMPSYLLAQTFFGKGKLKYEGKEYELSPDDIFLIDCRKDHEYYSDSEDGWGYRFVHFDGLAMPGYYQQITSSGNVKFSYGDDSRFIDLFKELFLNCKNQENNREITINRILTDMITEILYQLPQYQSVQYPAAIQEQCVWLQEHCCEKLTLEQFAHEFGLSKYYISHEFKKHTGTTIFGYITECRIAVSQRLLRYTALSISEIAELVGFEDHNGFYRTFRQKQGQSPSVYRKEWGSL